LWQGNRCCVLATIINCWHLKIIGKLSGTLAEMRMTSPLGVARALRLMLHDSIDCLLVGKQFGLVENLHAPVGGRT
jgi:hypothetical protein